MRDWISRSDHDKAAEKALSWDRARKHWLEQGDTESADYCRLQGEAWLWELYWYDTSRPLLEQKQPKRIVSDEEALAIEAAEALANLRRKLEPRANSSAFRPYSGGLPTLGKSR